MVWALVVCACGESKSSVGADGGPVVCPESALEPTSDCPPGACVNGPACEPIFDDCGDNEISLLGGGCQRVGLPPDCWDGWLPTDDGSCEPILPAEDCPDGTMPIIGEAECQPIRECGTSRWGNIDIQPGAVFVDQSYDGSNGSSNGTELRPYTTVQDGADDPSADQVVVAEGEYVEDVDVVGPLALDGRCPELTRIQGVSLNRPAVAVYGNAPIVRGVTVSGPSWGIGTAAEVSEVLLENLVVRDTGFIGIIFQDVSAGTVRRAVVGGTTGSGISAVTDATIVVEDVAVREVLPYMGETGRGISVEDFSHLDARRVLVTNAQDANIALTNSTADVTEAVVTGKVGEEVGAGIVVEDSNLTLTQSLVADNAVQGILAIGESRLVADQIVVRDSRSHALGDSGFGIDVNIEPSADPCLHLTRSLLIRNRTDGLWMARGIALVEEVVIADTLSEELSGKKGHGAQVGEDGAEAMVRRSLFRGNRAAGILVVGSMATLEEVTVRGTLPNESDGRLGVGVHGNPYPYAAEGTPSNLVVRNSLLSGNVSGGLVVTNSDLLAEYVSVRATQRAPDEEYGDGVVVVNYPERPVGAADLLGMLVEDNPRVGIGFWAADGSVRSSVVRSSQFGILLSDGASPKLNSVLCPTDECEPSYENLAPLEAVPDDFGP